MDMFFNGLADQNGESFKNAYREMSNGKFDLEGDVSDWVKVPNAASYYQDAAGEETGEAMTNFVQDGSDAWYDAQIADGKTDQQIKDYLATFDVWDRFDHDNDGVVNEPDGYIDHFQAIHAGEDESAGAPPWAIWAHRSSVNTNGDVGPAGNENGGVEIGDTGFWIRDYTTEPENGGLGVFAHEFAHDLGVPDYYDTQGGDNSTGFWTLMSQGSWMGHGNGTIGTTPDAHGRPRQAVPRLVRPQRPQDRRRDRRRPAGQPRPVLPRHRPGRSGPRRHAATGQRDHRRGRTRPGDALLLLRKR